MRISLTILLLASWASLPANAQTASEIFLFDLKATSTQISLTGGRNISNHEGYDNQPHFHPNKSLIYYSSFDENGRSDIKIFDIEKRTTSNLTKTHEREYSPTVTPDGRSISCIIQHDNGIQDLAAYPIAGGEATTLIDNLKVGYHCWMPNNKVMLFVLGDEMTLQIYDFKTQKSIVLAKNIGRSLHRIPNQSAMSFVQKKSADHWLIKRLDTKTREITEVMATLPQQEDLCWMPDGRILMSDGTRIFVADPDSQANRKWVPIEMGEMKLSGITRMAISSDGKRLATVADEPFAPRN